MIHLCESPYIYNYRLSVTNSILYIIGNYNQTVIDKKNKEQELMLDITLNHPEKIKSLLNEIYSAWREWNIASLAELLNIQVSMCPELHKRLVTTRNLAWSPKIISTITNGASAIITFGALHFLGVDGICHQIEDHGHHLEKL